MFISRLLAYISALFLIVVGPSVTLTEFSVGGYMTAPVISNAMEPEIEKGDLAIVKVNEVYEVGDIVIIRGEEKKTWDTLRIKSKRETKDGVICNLEGDKAEEIYKREILKREIIGKFAYAVPFVGYITNYAVDPFGFLIIIWVPASIVMWVGVIRPRMRAHRGY